MIAPYRVTRKSFGVVSVSVAPGGDWVVFHVAPEASIYTDPSTVHKEGDDAQITVLIDYTQPQMDKTGKQVFSDKVHYLYNCKEKTLSITGTSA